MHLCEESNKLAWKEFPINAKKVEHQREKNNHGTNEKKNCDM